MKYKVLTGIINGSIVTIPFVTADVQAGPEIIIIPIIGLALIAGFIVGAITLIRWITKKIKEQE